MNAEKQHKGLQQVDPIQSKREKAKLGFVDNRSNAIKQRILKDIIQKKPVIQRGVKEARVVWLEKMGMKKPLSYDLVLQNPKSELIDAWNLGRDPRDPYLIKSAPDALYKSLIEKRLTWMENIKPYTPTEEKMKTLPSDLPIDHGIVHIGFDNKYSHDLLKSLDVKLRKGSMPLTLTTYLRDTNRPFDEAGTINTEFMDVIAAARIPVRLTSSLTKKKLTSETKELDRTGLVNNTYKEFIYLTQIKGYIPVEDGTILLLPPPLSSSVSQDNGSSSSSVDTKVSTDEIT